MKRVITDFNVFIEHERINRVHVTKFLGIYIDDKLNWKYHINTVRSKLSKVAAIIYRASCLNPLELSQMFVNMSESSAI